VSIQVIDLFEALKRSLQLANGELTFGPELPVALCKCGHKLTFEQMRWRGRLVISTGWRCHCEGCVDGEYVGDPLTLQMTVVSGEGESPWEALDDLAAMHFDLMPEDLLVKEGT